MRSFALEHGLHSTSVPPRKSSPSASSSSRSLSTRNRLDGGTCPELSPPVHCEPIVEKLWFNEVVKMHEHYSVWNNFHENGYYILKEDTICMPYSHNASATFITERQLLEWGCGSLGLCRWGFYTSSHHGLCACQRNKEPHIHFSNVKFSLILNPDY